MSNHTAFIDGRPVPCVMSPNQARVLFPLGLAGLRECFGFQHYVFPETDGTLRLRSGALYAIAPSSTVGKWPLPHKPHPSQSVWSHELGTQDLSSHLNTDNDQGVMPSVNDSPSRHTQAFVDGTVKQYAIGQSHSFKEDDHDPDFNVSLKHSHLLIDKREGKLIQDRVHEYVFLPTVAVHIIDTIEFQRLRSLKQLGSVVFIYPGATHTRFEHCIGVAHLASKMVQHISTCQPELGVTRADILSVTIAGLCHDIGHGPFSHLFEYVVNSSRSRADLWHHEEMSVRLLRRILSRMNLALYGLTEEDARFIELCIYGLLPGAPWPSDVGRPPHKRFLVDIVANKRNGIDVDKFDYFLRDSLGCYGFTAVDIHIPRLLSACKALCFEGEYQICFEEKMGMSLGDIFNVRAKLHKYAYQHRIAKIIDYMICDALLEANPYFLIPGKDGQLIRITDSVDDDESFCLVGDWILNGILASSDSRLEKAQSIIRRINKRDLYTVVGIAMFARFQKRLTEEIIYEEIISLCDGLEGNSELRENVEKSLIVTFISITFGSSDADGVPDDPINHVGFYNPKNPDIGAFKLPKSRMSPLFSPSEYGERSVFVMVRDKAYFHIITNAFAAWKASHERHLGVAVPTYNTYSPGSRKRSRDAEDMSVERSGVKDQCLQRHEVLLRMGSESVRSTSSFTAEQTHKGENGSELRYL